MLSPYLALAFPILVVMNAGERSDKVELGCLDDDLVAVPQVHMYSIQ